jgi:hypothetical protein
MKPILFSTPMVQAILDGRKTMTRRIVKVNIADRFVLDDSGNVLGSYTEGMPEVYPTIDDAPYQEGDILWVRETWCNYNNKFYYKADKKCYGCTEDGICMPRGIESHITCELCESVGVDGYIRWRPSIHMPREAARIFLRVKTVRVERLQDITEEDAKAEGCMPTILDGVVFIAAKGEFHAIWDNLNAKRGFGWDANPWVWVISFERISEQEAKEHDRIGN